LSRRRGRRRRAIFAVLNEDSVVASLGLSAFLIRHCAFFRVFGGGGGDTGLSSLMGGVLAGGFFPPVARSYLGFCNFFGSVIIFLSWAVAATLAVVH